MKVGKRIIKCIIAATVLIAIVATAPVLSSASVVAAPAIKPNAEGTLTVTNIIRANCNVACPDRLNTGMNTIIQFGGKTFNFPVGPCCGEGSAVHATYNVPVYETYRITAEVHKKCVTTTPKFATYCYEHANIQGDAPFGRGGCTGLNPCQSTMWVPGGSGDYVRVNYHWKYNNPFINKPVAPK